MAQYTVTHTCGHNHTHQIYGTNSRGQRDNRREWLATQPCPKCAKAAREAENAAKNAEAAEANKAANLPTLTGTLKQIAWAESIRAEKLAYLKGLVSPEFKGYLKYGHYYVIFEKVIANLTAMTNAAFWIDNRFDLNREWLISEYKKLRATMPELAPKEISKGDIMRRAWQLAKDAAAKFGGKAKEYLSEAMKMAWAEAK